jgi:hypothetical protein
MFSPIIFWVLPLFGRRRNGSCWALLAQETGNRVRTFRAARCTHCAPDSAMRPNPLLEQLADANKPNRASSNAFVRKLVT